MKRLLNEINCCCCCLIAFLSIVQALPLQDTGGLEAANLNGTDVGNVCVHGDKTYTPGQNFSTSNPCETCTCDPPGVSCSLSSCDLKPGCKAIHKANQCCPEYVCECERNGKVYGNGEKVEEPNPCKVCYCKGGEIKCALVTCYTRDDCEPGYVAGVCCPKYDHCPPLEMMKNKSTTPATAQVIISDLKTESPPTKHKNLKKTVTQVSTTSESALLTTTTDDADAEATSTYGITDEPYNSTEEAERYELYITTDHTTEYYTTEITTEDNSTVETTAEEMTSTESSEDSTTEEMETTEENSSTVTEQETSSTTVSNYPTDPSPSWFDSTTEPDPTTEVEVTSEGFTLELLDEEEKTDSTVRNEVTTESPVEKPNKSVIKVIVPKTMKKDLEFVQRNVDGPAPIVVMISADQIQFLKLAEEPPLYVENRDAETNRATQDHIGVVVVPKTTPTTVEMVKVVDGTSVSDANLTTEPNFPGNSVNTTFSPNSTDLIQER